MKIRKFNKSESIKITNKDNEKSLKLSIFGPYFLDGADGMETLENEIFYTENFLTDGIFVTGSKIRERNLIFYIKTSKTNNWRYLLGFFNPKHRFQIQYNNFDFGIERYIDGYLERSPAINNDGVYVSIMVSFLCSIPFWYQKEVRTDIATWIGSFEFPLEIQENGIEMGYRTKTLIVNINNTSDNPAPVRVEFRAVGIVINPSIFNISTQELIKIEREMSAGDVIIINTVVGDEYAILEKNGVKSNVFNDLTLDSNPHFKLQIGDNLIRYDADENIDNLEVTIYFTPQFVGA